MDVAHFVFSTNGVTLQEKKKDLPMGKMVFGGLGLGDIVSPNEILTTSGVCAYSQRRTTSIKGYIYKIKITLVTPDAMDKGVDYWIQFSSGCESFEISSDFFK